MDWDAPRGGVRDTAAHHRLTIALPLSAPQCHVTTIGACQVPSLVLDEGALAATCTTPCSRSLARRCGSGPQCLGAPCAGFRYVAVPSTPLERVLGFGQLAVGIALGTVGEAARRSIGAAEGGGDKSPARLPCPLGMLGSAWAALLPLFALERCSQWTEGRRGRQAGRQAGRRGESW